MPLDKSGSKASVGKNISAEMHSGMKQKQAIAVAMETRRRAMRVKRPTIAKVKKV